MRRRKHLLVNNEIYHIFNRSVGHENIFSNNWYLRRTVSLIDYYRYPQTLRYSKFKSLPLRQRSTFLFQNTQPPLVEIYAFALMPNHYHFMMKQLRDDGIKLLISNFQNSFAKFFNLKNRRHGTLFQNAFSSRRIETDEEFIHLARYIHLNPVSSYLFEIKDLQFYPWTSYYDYIQGNRNKFISTQFLNGFFKSKTRLKEFTEDRSEYQRKLEKIKHLIID